MTPVLVSMWAGPRPRGVVLLLLHGAYRRGSTPAYAAGAPITVDYAGTSPESAVNALSDRSLHEFGIDINAESRPRRMSHCRTPINCNPREGHR